MKRSFGRWTSFAAPTTAAMLALAGCGAQESAPPPAVEATTAVADAQPTLAPPGAAEFTTAWADACPSAQPVSTALCKSKGLTDPNFSCDFGLGEDEYRRHTAELARGDESWELADAENACQVGAEA
ncbi:hypothetical protein V5740_14470 (plasmid) [Croceibacterium sp. TMG7-5b_MA50]|uniref:hypothetical protein n=1 Tax=Croceibacterium sp. TMG7-5b_MA50 TaxID=3121290 RepID=UPI003221DC24